MKSISNLNGKNVFITGGLSGIGKKCALYAARDGANVIVADLDSPAKDATMAEIKKWNAKAIFIPCNVSNFNEVESAIAEAVNVFGSLDVALNNAGIGGESSRIGDMTEKAWHDVIAVNLNGVFNCMKHELYQMSKQKSGVIINMSSILGKVGFANAGHYVAAKHGVIGLTQTAAMEYALEGIRINAICPGFVSTPLLESGGISQNAEVKTMIENLHPMKRFGDDDEIANVFLFLATEGSSFMTGTAVEVDGGYLAQ
jgi:NAD(P)-dependent dehydrogenase (short-subunit alcohol dehydrogenase family)